jgi:hypothetical protein
MEKEQHRRLCVDENITHILRQSIGNIIFVRVCTVSIQLHITRLSYSERSDVLYPLREAR